LLYWLGRGPDLLLEFEMKLFKIIDNDKIFVGEVFSFVGADNKVMEDGHTGNWILEAGDKKFIYSAVVGDEWWEV
jgi:hypothetical protein